MKKALVVIYSVVISTLSFSQTILVEKAIYNSTKPIHLHSINGDLREVYFSTPQTKSMLFYKIAEDKVVEDKTITATKFKGFVRLNEVYSLVQYQDRIDVISALRRSDRYTLINSSEGININSIAYDVESKLFYTLSGDNILEMELTQDEIIRVDTTLRKLKVDGKAQRLSSFGGKPFVSVEHGLNLSDIYMVDSNSTLKLRYPINYNAQNVSIEFLNDDTLFVSRNLRPGESELVMIYASNISRHPDSLYLDKINDRAQEQIDSVKAEAIVNALEFTDTVTRDVGQGRFSTLIKRTNDAIVAMTTLNSALGANSKSFISSKDSMYFVLGPKRTSETDAKKDSLYYAKMGLMTSIIDLGNDSIALPEDVIIRLKCLDKQTGEKPPFSVDFYEYETNTLVKSANLYDGEICYFSYIPTYKLGLTITSEGYLPHSIRFDNTKKVIRQKQIEKLVLLQRFEEGKEGSFTLNNIQFDFAKWDLTPVAKRELDIIKTSLSDATSVTIEGHTDWIGSDSFNLSLSRKRANETQKYLIKNGVDASKLKTIGKGEKEPIAPNKTVAGRAKNRRAEFLIK